MKAHKYQVTTYEGFMDMVHKSGQTQYRLYIPGQGVFGYRNKEKIDFFRDEREDIEQAEDDIRRGRIQNIEDIKYLGEVELPDKVVLTMMYVGKELNKTRIAFEESAKILVDLLEK